MDIDLIFESEFHRNVAEFNKQLRLPNWSLKCLNKFPFTKFITNGDEFFRHVWRAIDKSQHYFWITTYAMDSSPAADATLLKLIQAVKRGVHVVLYIDNVQSWAKKQLIAEFVSAGGRYLLLNPLWEFRSIYKYFTKDVWRRHHQKLIVSDHISIIGSSNIEGGYAGIRYGDSNFRDINFYSENIILDQFRKHFIDTANQYSFNLETGKEDGNFYDSNNKIVSEFDEKYPNSLFYEKGKYQILHNDQRTKIKQIEKQVLAALREAKIQIKVIQPYHYTISKFDRQMRKAISRLKIKPEIITSGKRDQPVFRSLSNEMLFERLLKKGVALYETKEGFLHSKVYMFDKRWVNMGSMNNDRWSWAINNECNILIDDPRIYEEVNVYFQQLKKTCKLVNRGYNITADQAVSIGFWQWFLYLSEIVMSQSGPPEEDYIKFKNQNKA